MGVRDEQYDRTHEAILTSAARLLRERGLGASVAQVMKGAGLTVGGFYAHFGSKEDLLGKAFRHAAREMWGKLVAAGDLTQVLRMYLSRAHRDHPAAGCLLPATVGEIAREGEPYRAALAETIDAYARDLERFFPTDARRKALATIALMFGALSLARAVAGTPLSDELLRAARAVGAATADPKIKED